MIQTAVSKEEYDWLKKSSAWSLCLSSASFLIDL